MGGRRGGGDDSGRVNVHRLRAMIALRMGLGMAGLASGGVTRRTVYMH